MKVGSCIYCGKTADTGEHIPAKQFFKGAPDKPLIKVPSCRSCNQGFQKDEDFFRQFYVSMLMDRSPQAKQLLENEVSRSIARAPALGRRMFSQMELVDYYKAGVYLGQRTKYEVSDHDKKRINRVVDKIVKGLFFHEFQQTLPEDWLIQIIWINPKSEKELKLGDLARTLQWNVIKEDTFAYGVNHVSDTYQSVWIIDFFKVPLFYVLVVDNKTAGKACFTSVFGFFGYLLRNCLYLMKQYKKECLKTDEVV